MQARLSLDKSKLKFLLLEGIHPSAVEALNRDGYHQLETHAQALAGDELIAAIRDAHFVGLRSRSQLTEAVLSQAPKLTAIGCFCIGTNQVDLQAPRGVAFRYSTRRSRIRAALPNWCSARSSCCCAASPKKTRSCIVAAG